MKPLLVGEVNPYGPAEEFALYPDPPGCAGWRLCRLVMRLEPDDYLDRFDRVNLCAHKWSAPEARRRADEISRDARTYVLLGRKVSGAFSHVLGRAMEPFVWYEQADDAERRYVVLPHPSGLNRMWGEPGALDRAWTVLQRAGVL
jgi:hypothetical protein